MADSILSTEKLRKQLQGARPYAFVEADLMRSIALLDLLRELVTFRAEQEMKNNHLDGVAELIEVVSDMIAQVNQTLTQLDGFSDPAPSNVV